MGGHDAQRRGRQERGRLRLPAHVLWRWVVKGTAAGSPGSPWRKLSLSLGSWPTALGTPRAPNSAGTQAPRKGPGTPPKDAATVPARPPQRRPGSLQGGCWGGGGAGPGGRTLSGARPVARPAVRPGRGVHQCARAAGPAGPQLLRCRHSALAGPTWHPLHAQWCHPRQGGQRREPLGVGDRRQHGHPAGR